MRGWTARVSVLVVVAAVIAGLALAPQVALAKNTYANKIAFTKAGHIWICDPSGKKVARLTNSSATDGYPRWSADHRTVYFIRTQGATTTLMRVGAGGGLATQVPGTTPDGGEWAYTSIALTPDGNSIVFSDFRNSGEPASEIVLASMAGGSSRTLLSVQDVGAPRLEGVSRDGTTLLYTWDGGDASQLHLLRLGDGADTAKGPAMVSSVTWSPSGTAIAYSTVNFATDRLALMRPSGSTFRTLKTWKGYSAMRYDPLSFSPDGKYLLLGGTSSKGGGFYTMNLSNKKLTRISKWSGYKYYEASWR